MKHIHFPTGTLRDLMMSYLRLRLMFLMFYAAHVFWMASFQSCCTCCVSSFVYLYMGYIICGQIRSIGSSLNHIYSKNVKKHQELHTKTYGIYMTLLLFMSISKSGSPRRCVFSNICLMKSHLRRRKIPKRKPLMKHNPKITPTNSLSNLSEIVVPCPNVSGKNSFEPPKAHAKERLPCIKDTFMQAGSLQLATTTVCPCGGWCIRLFLGSSSSCCLVRFSVSYDILCVPAESL